MIVRDSGLRWQPQLESAPAAPLHSGYQIQVSSEPEDRAWDSFLVQTPGGHHVQTSLWGQVKAYFNWRAVRVIVRQDHRIVAGAQMLIKPLPVSIPGAIGQVIRGPLFACDDLDLHRLVMDRLHVLARAHNVHYLVVQPPYGGEAFARQLPTWGFQQSSDEVAPSATLLLDLTPSLEDILTHVRSSTRKHIRTGLRKGITVREGTLSDLPTFYRLYAITARRQNFTPPPEDYFFTMWRTFAPYGYIRLLLAEYAGEAVSARLVIPFGDTVLFKVRGWSGLHGDRRPNEVLQWEAIAWARAQGYRYCDVDGVDSAVALALKQDESSCENITHDWSTFKLKFGGQLISIPGTYEHVYNPLLRWGYRTVYPKLANWPLVSKMLEQLWKR